MCVRVGVGGVSFLCSAFGLAMAMAAAQDTYENCEDAHDANTYERSRLHTCEEVFCTYVYTYI